jgi:hypothetical protein
MLEMLQRQQVAGLICSSLLGLSTLSLDPADIVTHMNYSLPDLSFLLRTLIVGRTKKGIVFRFIEIDD